MFARIESSKDNTRTVRYNERKVERGGALRLFAGNFLLEADDLNTKEIRQRFQQQLALNDRVKTNTLHISLSFSAKDRLDSGRISEISESYMEKIGFGAQPYVVYQHLDAGHPHAHIVTILVQPDGTRIPTNCIGIRCSEKARKELIQEYHLTPPRTWQQVLEQEGMKPAKKVQYGKEATKQSVTRVLDNVLTQYHYTTLQDLNAILSLYNVRAVEGLPGNPMHTRQGLVYQVLKDNGKQIGQSIPASGFHSRPTLSFLQEQFLKNLEKGPVEQTNIRNAVYQAVHSDPDGWEDFAAQLKEVFIYAIPQKEKSGIVGSISFVDVKNKVVSNSERVGMPYPAKEILEAIGVDQHLHPIRFKDVERSAQEQLTQKQSYAHRRE